MTELNITPEQGGDTQAHIDAMVKKADEANQPAPAAAPAEAPVDGAAERPAWLPEKFATPEDMAKAYASLEGKLSGKPEEKPAENPEGKPAEQVSDEEASKTAEAAVEAAGLDMNALGEKIATNGDLDATDYEALTKVGISKDMVNAYVDGQRAMGEQLVSRLHQTVGGEETFNGIVSWAAENLPADEIAAFNDTVDNGSEQAIQLALRGLHSQYQAAGQQAPKLLSGGKPESSGDVFRSTAELTKAMGDRRYQTDPAYRQDVANKLARSSIL